MTVVPSLVLAQKGKRSGPPATPSEVLRSAAANGNTEIVNLLLAHGADVDPTVRLVGLHDLLHDLATRLALRKCEIAASSSTYKNCGFGKSPFAASGEMPPDSMQR